MAASGQRHHAASGAVADALPLLAPRSAVMIAFERMLAEAARCDVPVLLLGEGGTGKNTYVRALHAMSPRASHPLVRVDCRAGTAALEVLVERTPGGVLFLDEVASLTSTGQTAALKLLEDASAGHSAGGVRVVASSARDLAADVTTGLFRADLFYRLSVIELRLPPLRERREDLLPLAHAALATIAHRLRRPVPALSPELERLLARYAWPGNVTQLLGTLERLVILTPPGAAASGEALPEQLRSQLALDDPCSRE